MTVWITIAVATIAFILGWAVAALLAASGEDQASATWNYAETRVRDLEMNLRNVRISRDLAVEQREDAEKERGQAIDALRWLVEEIPGLDAALEWPADATDTIKRIETLQEDLGRQDATDAWRNYLAGER